jgi:hypothetical protein
MLAGIRSKLAEANRSFVNGFVICGSSGDDTSNNIHDPSHLYAELGQYALVPNVGVPRAKSVDDNPAKAAIVMNGPNNATQLAKVGTLGDLLGVDGAKKVLSTAANLSERQLAAFKAKDLPTQIKDLVECGYAMAPNQIGKYTQASLTPANDPIISQVFTLGNGTQSRAGTVALLVLRGMAGVGTVQIGGYDYHNQGIANQDSKDNEAGTAIGAIMEAAVRIGVTTQINVWSDGSVGYDGSGAPTGDRGTKGLVVSFIVTPGKTPEVLRTQIGAYSENGSVDSNVGPWSQSPAEQARALFFNGLLALGRGDELTKFSRLPLIITALEASSAFTKVV